MSKKNDKTTTKPKCLVLGANGFIGSHLVDSLIEAGFGVKAFDRFPDSNYRFNEDEDIEIIHGNFLNRDELVTALKDVDYVFHLISTTTPATAENDPIIDIETNIKMSVELFLECANQGVKKIIFPSSGGAIYGDNSTKDTDERVLPLPMSPYAIGKLTIENYLRYFKKKYRLKSVVYRISNPYGVRQPLRSKQGVIPIFLNHIAKDEPVTILGDGDMVRDYIYVKDVTDLIAKTFQSSKSDVYNLGSGQGTSINQLIQTIKDVTGKDIKVIHKENPSTYVDEIVLNIDKFIKEFDLKPKVSLKDGILATWKSLQE